MEDDIGEHPRSRTPSQNDYLSRYQLAARLKGSPPWCLFPSAIGLQVGAVVPGARVREKIGVDESPDCANNPAQPPIATQLGGSASNPPPPGAKCFPVGAVVLAAQVRARMDAFVRLIASIAFGQNPARNSCQGFVSNISRPQSSRLTHAGLQAGDTGVGLVGAHMVAQLRARNLARYWPHRQRVHTTVFPWSRSVTVLMGTEFVLTSRVQVWVRGVDIEKWRPTCPCCVPQERRWIMWCDLIGQICFRPTHRE